MTAHSLNVAAIALASILAGCDMMPTKPPAPVVTTAVKTIPAPDKPVAAPCVSDSDIPEPFVSRIPADGDPAQRAAGADVDLTWIVPRYIDARNKLINCSQIPKEP